MPIAPHATPAGPDAASAPLSRSATRHVSKVAAGLSRAFDASARVQERVELEALRVVIVSDLHKGQGDGADDFRRCERAYNAALAYYHAAGHRLVVLGDAEELWECRAQEVLAHYAHTLDLEAEFHHAGRYVRVWGNHDEDWRYPRNVARHLHGRFPGLKVREALRWEVMSVGDRLGTVFLVHGHQGTLASDRLGVLSRFVVRHLWRPLQRRLDIPSTTPARDWGLRETHDRAMFAWARDHSARPILIAGHTHRPVFRTSAPTPDIDRTPTEIDRELAAVGAEPGPPQRVALLRAELEFAQAELRRTVPPQPVDPPCYFNTGCCSFGDGDITVLEIADRHIRLVRWPDESNHATPEVLASALLEDVLAAVAEP